MFYRVLFYQLFLWFTHDLSLTQCPIYYYGDEAMINLSTSFTRRTTLQQKCYIILFVIFHYTIANLVMFNVSKLNFTRLLTIILHSSFMISTVSPSTSNILGLSSAKKNVNWKVHICYICYYGVRCPVTSLLIFVPHAWCILYKIWVGSVHTGSQGPFISNPFL